MRTWPTCQTRDATTSANTTVSLIVPAERVVGLACYPRTSRQQTPQNTRFCSPHCHVSIFCTHIIEPAGRKPGMHLPRSGRSTRSTCLLVNCGCCVVRVPVTLPTFSVMTALQQPRKSAQFAEIAGVGLIMAACAY